MILQNISKRKVLLLIINALVSVLLISCILFLYHYIPTAISAARPSIFTVEKGNGIHITKASSSHFIASSGSPTRSVIVANVKSLQQQQRRLDRLPQSSSEEDAIDDTIYIDSDSYSDESYDSTSSQAVTSREYDDSGMEDDDDVQLKAEKIPQRAAAPVTIIERPVESPSSDDDLYYENYEDDETDDEDIVSSGNGRIVVNVRKSAKKQQQKQQKKQQQTTQSPSSSPSQPDEPLANYVENVYSVSSEIVSNLKSQYNPADNKQLQSDNEDGIEDESDDEDEISEVERTPPPPKQPAQQMRRVNSRRMSANSKKLAERSRQLILCRSANMGELCRMLN